MLKIFKFFKWYHWIFVLAIVGFVYGQVQMDLLLPEYMGKIIILIVQGIQTGTSQTSAILDEGGMMLLITLGSVTATVVVSYIAARLGTRLAATTRRNLFHHVQGFSSEEMNKFSTPSLITRTTNDVQQVQMTLIIMLRMLITAPIMAISGINKITNINTTMSMVVIGGVVAIIVLILTIFILVGPRFSRLQKQTDDLNQVTRETLTGIRVVRAHHAEDIQSEKFEEVNTNLTKTNIFVNTAMSFMMPGMSFIMNSLNLGLILVGSLLISDNLLGANPVEGLSLMLQFTSYAMIILIAFMMLIMLFIFLPRAWVSGKRIMEVLETEYKIDDRYADSTRQDLNVEVEFKNVSFKYPNAEDYVLKNISFKAKKGETLAFIGSTGSGKSTIIQLILRFYDASEGEILINKKAIKTYTLSDLYELMGYVPQKGNLFSGDIKSNITLGNESATEEEVLHALEVAQIKDFVDESELKLKRPIDQGGTNVSGGQKQRLSIARVLVKKPSIYIFDDSFSALDYRTDKSLRNALKSETKNALKIIIGQRIGTILDAEQIIVLDEGVIVGKGTHKELLETCKPYQDIAFAQLSKEELSHV
ncbi:MAG: multidrug ABC transporter ATP-binding protein [Tenericutes bacterium GWC2_39_45]|nr:MAG: multidrug ABC transporter ATP-binding protein [Tenericutes bacterium GWC2_39_45]OHE32299.1 MAG: multidrug ABC transporter ATP-binding protein [Tenericutes bacterium GWD2_38_27]HBG33257.1 multidrug ABC transporter ATP-binding protein [Acholeplasmataceae bacterium]